MVRTWNTHLPQTVQVETTDWVGGLYFLREEAVIAGWKADDRAERVALNRLEQRRLHQDNRRLIRGRWDTTARECHHAEHPLYYREVVGVSALTKRRVARVRIACSPVRLWVQLPSKNAIRQAKRYGAIRAEDLEKVVWDKMVEVFDRPETLMELLNLRASEAASKRQDLEASLRQARKNLAQVELEFQRCFGTPLAREHMPA